MKDKSKKDEVKTFKLSFKGHSPKLKDVPKSNPSLGQKRMALGEQAPIPSKPCPIEVSFD